MTIKKTHTHKTRHSSTDTHLGDLQPSGIIFVVFHVDEQQVGVACGVWNEGILARTPGMI